MGQDNAISASVKNNGVEAVDGWKAMLYADGEPVDSLSGEEIEAFADTILTFNYHPSVTETKRIPSSCWQRLHSVLMRVR